MTADDSIIPVFWILGGTIIVLILSGIIILIVRNSLKRREFEKRQQEEIVNKYEQEITSNVLEIQDQERNRIALNLHDSIVSELQLIRLSNLNNGNKHELDGQIKRTLKSIRHLSHDLHPPQLDMIGLEELIHDYLIRLQPTIPNSYHITRLDHQLLQEATKMNLFRIFQEVITNVIKHARATQVDVILRQSSHSVSLLVKDNGRGISITKQNGIGMKTIDYRAKQMGAHYKYATRVTYGTAFIITLRTETTQHEKPRK